MPPPSTVRRLVIEPDLMALQRFKKPNVRAQGSRAELMRAIG